MKYGWLLLASLVQSKSAADYYVRSLPGQPEGSLLNMHAGHIEVDKAVNANLFFWHIQNRHRANRQRTVIWFNGGPGCSSMDGALMEVGPYRLVDDAHLRYNDGSWDEFANLLFIDNPVGTGYSYVNTDNYVHELSQMADHIIVFLTSFFSLFPEYEDDDLYLAGESYAGQHIPYIARAILDHNSKTGISKKWNLSGLLIGNGWVAPTEQYDAYLNMAYNVNIVKKSTKEADELEEGRKLCNAEIEAPGGKKRVSIPVCEKVLQDILRLAGKDGRCPNMYDVRLDDTFPSCGMNWPPDLTSMTPYLRREEVKAALHVNADKHSGWTECSGAVSSSFKADADPPAIEILPDLLTSVPILLFSGDQDLICNHLGTEEYIHNMQWNGAKGFELSPGTWAPRRHWTFEGESAGIYQEARNLTYLLFYNSSHMVPFDYPRRSRDMLDRFLGVDITSIGGQAADSRIDGEKGVETSVSSRPNSTAVDEQKIDKAKWAAYSRSSKIALFVVILLAGFFGWYVWRDRRRRAGYAGVALDRRDVEAADFDEAELDDLHIASPHDEGVYALGDASDSDSGHKGKGPSRAYKGSS